MKHIFVIAIVFLVCITCFNAVNSAGECGTMTPDQVAFNNFQPCLTAAQDVNAPVSWSCCSAVYQIGGSSASCLCAVMLSRTSQSYGARPEISITIPKRCNIAQRPIGSKCGAYTLP